MALSLIDSAQQPANSQRIGFLGPSTSPLLEVLRKSLVDLGYRKNIFDGVTLFTLETEPLH
jgi:hypothetical protein